VELAGGTKDGFGNSVFSDAVAGASQQPASSAGGVRPACLSACLPLGDLRLHHTSSYAGRC
jgi:hypothetical protein